MKGNYKNKTFKFLLTYEYDEKTPGLFKVKFNAKRMIKSTSKCYYEDDSDRTYNLAIKVVKRDQLI